MRITGVESDQLYGAESFFRNW